MHVDLFATPHRFFIYIPDNDVLKVVTPEGRLKDIGCTGHDRYDADMDFVETLTYNDVNGFVECVNKIMQIQSVAEKEWNYLNKYYSTRNGYDIIMKHF